MIFKVLGLMELQTRAVEAAVLLLVVQVLVALAALELSSFVGLHLFQHPLPQREALR
tara:strand:+ start:2434 stop:2604 length:171 start_codon:yes stop_codon:yes gene_type:complete